MQLTRGDYLGFLNSDDFFSDNALELLEKYINNFPDKDFIFGSVRKHWGVLYGYKPYKIYWSWGFYSSHSTGFFIKRDSAKKVGLFNTKYKYHADYDFFYRMIINFKLKGMSTKKDEILGHFSKGGFSSKINYITHLKDLNKIRINNKQNIIFVHLLYIFKIIKKPLKFLSSL